MTNFTIFTNNPAVKATYPQLVTEVSGDVGDVFTAVRDAVHRGAVLISHPLAGSIKPNESPYKSVMASASVGALHTDSLALIEGAAAVLRKMPLKHREYPQQVLDDFAVIDLDLMHSAMASLPPDYHL